MGCECGKELEDSEVSGLFEDQDTDVGLPTLRNPRKSCRSRKPTAVAAAAAAAAALAATRAPNNKSGNKHLQHDSTHCQIVTNDRRPAPQLIVSEQPAQMPAQMPAHLEEPVSQEAVQEVRLLDLELVRDLEQAKELSVLQMHQTEIEAQILASDVIEPTLLESHSRVCEQMQRAMSKYDYECGAADLAIAEDWVYTWKCRAVVDAHPKCTKFYEPADGALCGAFTCDNSRIVTAGCDNMIQVWNNRADPTNIRTINGHDRWVLAVGAHPIQPDLLLSTSRDETLRLWDIDSGTELMQTRAHGEKNTLTVNWSDDGDKIVTGSSDNTLKLWDATTWHCTATLEGHEGWITKGAAFISNGQQIISGSRDTSIRLWDVRTSSEVGRIARAHKSDVTDVAVLGHDCFSVSTDMHLRHWDLRNMGGHCVSQAKAHEKEITGVSFCADYSRLCTSSKDRVIGTWDYLAGSLQAGVRCVEHTEAVNCVFGGKDSIASLGGDGEMRVWVNARTRSPRSDKLKNPRFEHALAKEW